MTKETNIETMEKPVKPSFYIKRGNFTFSF